MRRFTQENIVSAVKRLVYSGSPSKGVMTDQGITSNCYLRPLSEEAAAVNGMQWGTGYTMITETGVNILQGDIVTVGGIDYTVRGRADHNRGYRTAYQRYLIVKAQA